VTAYAKPVAQRPQNWLAQLRALAAANAATSTQYVVEHPPRTKKEAEEETPESERGVCTAIIGNLAAEPDGTSTGLSGWGIAVKSANGAWVKVSGAGPFVNGAEAVNASATAAVKVRLEEGGATARLEGNLQASAAAIPASTALFTIPPAYRPANLQRFAAVNASAASVGEIQILAGVVTFDLELAKGNFLEWGSQSYAT
jgi:hypothetical protein